MLEKILAEKIEIIDRSASYQKAETAYLVNLIEPKYETLIKIFDPEKKISSEELPEHIYDSVKSTIFLLNEQETAGFGMKNFWPTKGVQMKHPAVELGWATFSGIENNGPYNLNLTEEGLRIIDAYRSAVGLVSVKEQQKFNNNNR